jgi:hypothetical protein
MKQPAGVMSEEVLAEKVAIVAGGAKVAEEATTSRNSIKTGSDGNPATSRASLPACHRTSTDGNPAVSRGSLAGAVNHSSTDGRLVSNATATQCHDNTLTRSLLAGPAS